MLAAKVRSGLAETLHEGVVAVVDPGGALVAWSGDLDRPFFLRSSAKPFQAAVSQESGAGLGRLELAVACASHHGFPVHTSIVRSMLAGAGLDESDLRCPPAWPLDPAARDLLVRRGESRKRSLWNNCSGKHAGFLRACRPRGWPTESYLEAGHPLQRRVVEFVSELGEFSVQPVGVDGCGVPVLRTNARAMALLFARLGTLPELAEVFAAMHAYPALVGSNGAGDSTIATATNSVAKGGALGCIGVALKSGLGVAVKSWDGLNEIADVAAVAALDALGALPAGAVRSLDSIARPAQMGGGKPQGAAESRLELQFA